MRRYPTLTRPHPGRYVYAAHVRCPQCDSDVLQTYRSTRQADSVVSRHIRCQACGWKFIVDIE